MLLQTIEQIGREKNIEPEVIIEAIEEAMAVAAQKFYRTDDYLEAHLDPETGEVTLHSVKRVVEEVEEPTEEISVEEAQKQQPGLDIGDELRIPMPTDQLGRIAAQAAKQVIFQKVRDAERDNIHAEYAERTGELVTGVVKRFERGDMVVEIERIEAILPRREQSRAEHYNLGDRIRVVIIDVLRATRGPQVVVSRSSPILLERLFEMEVPEIYDKTVEIKGAVREAGDRAKVAVHSVEPDVDPVGACVGMRGSRVQSIIRELRGEKIDIVEWADDPYQFAVNALKPARVNRVEEQIVTTEEGDEEEHLVVVVDEDQLSLAIGKRGQNVRLAGKLLGRKIDVMGEGGEADEVEATPPGELSVDAVPGISAEDAEALRDAGFNSAEIIVAGGPDALLAVPGIDPKAAPVLHEAARVALETGVTAPEPDTDAPPADEPDAAEAEDREADSETAGEEPDGDDEDTDERS